MNKKLSASINLTSLGVLTLMLGLFAIIFTSPANAADPQFGSPTTLNANYSCSDATYGTSGSYWGKVDGSGTTLVTYTDRSTYSYSCQTNHTSNASGAVVTATMTLRAATAQTVGLIANRINAVKTAALREEMGLSLTSLSLSPDLQKGEFGLAGGNSKKGVGVWIQGRFSDIESDNASTTFDGDIVTTLFGIDKTFKNGKVLVGISAGYEDQDFTTTFNKGTLDGDGFIVAPYVSINAGKGWSIDATAGYADMDYDMTRKDPVNSEKFTSSTDGDRTFLSASANYDKLTKKSKGIFRLGLRLGVSHAEEEKDAHTETGTTGTTVSVAATDTDLTQLKFGAETGFRFKAIEPFINFSGEYDVSKSDAPKVAVSTTAFNLKSAQTAAADDNWGARLGGGLNIWFGDRATAMIGADTVLGRDDYSETSGTARFRLNF